MFFKCHENKKGATEFQLGIMEKIINQINEIFCLDQIWAFVNTLRTFIARVSWRDVKKLFLLSNHAKLKQTKNKKANHVRFEMSRKLNMEKKAISICLQCWKSLGKLKLYKFQIQDVLTGVQF